MTDFFFLIIIAYVEREKEKGTRREILFAAHRSPPAEFGIHMVAERR
jgi:hypothetical protein